MSAALCLGKSIEEVKARPLEKWDNTNGVSAMNEFVGTDGAKMAAHLVENLTDPATARSQEPHHAAVQRAFATKLDFHQWQQRPENARRCRRFQNAMFSLTGLAATEHPQGGFDWAVLPAGSLVVDVGGGLGTVTLGLAERHAHLRYVIQDLPAVIAQTREHWSSAAGTRGILEKGVVTLHEHDFFTAQPPAAHNAAVYMLRFILHNWPDAYCARVLRRLRDAVVGGGRETRLVVLEQIVDDLSVGRVGAAGGPEGGVIGGDVPGATRPRAPAPLLPFPESVAGYTFGMDMLMMGELNSQERTLAHFAQLFRGAGWQLERVCRFPTPHPQQLICTPL